MTYFDVTLNALSDVRLQLFQSYLESQYNTFSTGTRRLILLLGHVVFLGCKLVYVHASCKYLQW